MAQALQATIEKMKLDYDALKKKSKMNDLRLNQLVKDQNDIIAGMDRFKLHCDEIDAMHCADMTHKMDSLQADKEQYEAWIRDSNLQEYYLSSKAGGLTKPGRARPLTPSGVSVVSAVGRVDGAPSRQAAATRGSRLSADEATYAEEVFLFDEGTNTAVNGAFDNDTVSIGSPQQQKSNTLFERKSSGFNENGFTAHSTVGVGRISTLETHSSEDMVNIGTGTVHSVGLLSTIASGRSVGKRPRRVDDVPETMDGIKQEPAPPSNGGRVEVVTDDGTRIISYRNGTRKEVCLPGVVLFK